MLQTFSDEPFSNYLCAKYAPCVPDTFRFDSKFINDLPGKHNNPISETKEFFPNKSRQIFLGVVQYDRWKIDVVPVRNDR